MDQDEYVIFAELDGACFEQIVASLQGRFARLQFGRQGDDWIWLEHRHGRMEIDTFYSTWLELKGRRRDYGLAREVLACLQPAWIEHIFQPPRVDVTR
ncbi:hypothetical protein PU634_13975 [Oceanimonas pelagia]|uniref:Uncharacterized protein n=1 Tax=Oceanimonas pelagia TaxID=3028314 RepID=A0AA50QBJ4_9GAMM|nr:hypothetical protein [Oceanimonas pelagia]WMC10181.1 hypothetical protein PU634_13975 [Oceanimonas pelagia]